MHKIPNNFSQLKTINIFSVCSSQIHNHGLLFHLIHLNFLYRKSSLFTSEPLGCLFVCSPIVGAGPIGLALSLDAIRTDHQVVAKADQIVGCDEDGLARWVFFYFEFLVFSQRKHKSLVVSYVIFLVFADFDGSETPNDLVHAGADEHQQRVAVEQVRRAPLWVLVADTPSENEV